MILISVIILFCIALVVLALNRINLRPGYSWFLAVIGSAAVWVILFFSYSPEPQVISLMVWETSFVFNASASLVLDTYSWSFSVGIATLMISTLLTDVARVKDVHPGSWATSLAMAGAGILAVTSATLLTLLMAWALIDITEANTLLRAVSDSKQRERVVVTFSVRIIGLLLVIAAFLRAEAVGVAFSLTNIPAESASYLVLAAGLRLGVIPPHPPFLVESDSRRNLGTIVRLVPVAASLVLLVRIAEVGVSFRWELALMIIALWALIYGAFTWIFASNELDGRPYWIFGVSALAVISALRMQPFASLSWGLALIFSGGMLFLYSTHSSRFNWLMSLGLVGFSALPFTPAWRGAAIFSQVDWIFSLVSGIGLAALLAGYIKHTVRFDDSQEEIERWVWLVYPLGLALLPLTHFGVVWTLGGIYPPDVDLLTLEWWGGGIAVGITAIIWIFSRRQVSWATKVVDTVQRAFSLSWFYRILWWVYRTTSKLISYIEQLLEGEGGVLWAVLIIILMVLFLVQQAGGGGNAI